LADGDLKTKGCMLKVMLWISTGSYSFPKWLFDY